ncbi:MerR family transcriptional regulator [Streptomyces gardneri]|uniref:MerR family transcriptional regulator n=1 Tax=Nocardia TaxID=1817 RepID=UPI00135AACDB|nr:MULTISPECIES: MerR family transcriptional regulator [Nocardia]MBF6167064.1 MerR family transcriptional regulator [Streptomyces gardneri]MBF6204111.1 MerR family transcriptional regulator [Streptomyces gardneri]UAK30677.1 MerR family transcriptional regulator [Nocardia asteroides]
MTGGDISIGELAARFGLAAHVLRHWEDVGLLAPRRDSAGRRRYRDDDAETVAMILLGKQVGLSLEDLAVLFAEASDRAARRDLLRAHRDQLVRRIAQATAALDTITHALDCAAEDFRDCPHFQAKVAHALTLVTNRSSRGR